MRIRSAVWAAVCGLVIAAPSSAVDGVIEINQARASAGGVTPGDAAGSLVHGSTIVIGGEYGIDEEAPGALGVDGAASDNDGAIIRGAFAAWISGGYRGCVITGNDGTEEVQPITAGGVLNLGHNVCGSDTICP